MNDDLFEIDMNTRISDDFVVENVIDSDDPFGINDIMKTSIGSGELDDNWLFEMANIHSKDTGLKTSLHAMYNGANEGFSHGPRVKVSTNQHGRIPIQLKPTVKLSVEKNLRKEDKDIINDAISYISSNLDLFLDHWNGKITDFELISRLRQR